MDYQDTLGWLFGLETMGIKLGLQNITELLHRMGDPQEQFRSVHVAGSGTSGEGDPGGGTWHVRSITSFPHICVQRIVRVPPPARPRVVSGTEASTRYWSPPVGPA